LPGVTAEALWAKIDEQSAFCKEATFLRRRKRPPPIISTRIDTCKTYNFVADSFHTKNFVADFLQAKCDFTQKTVVLGFEHPLKGRRLGATYVKVHLRFIGKRVVEQRMREMIPIGVLKCNRSTNFSAYSVPTCKPKISGRRGRPHQPLFFSKN